MILNNNEHHMSSDKQFVTGVSLCSAYALPKWLSGVITQYCFFFFVPSNIYVT